MDWNLIVPVMGVIGIVPAGIGLRTECVPSTRSAKSWGSGHSTTRRMGRVRRLSSHRGTRGHNEEHEQEDEKEAMMQVMKSARIAQADGIRFSNYVHDEFLSEDKKIELHICGIVIINSTINSGCRF